jgi:hypothetical protein
VSSPGGCPELQASLQKLQQLKAPIAYIGQDRIIGATATQLLHTELSDTNSLLQKTVDTVYAKINPITAKDVELEDSDMEDDGNASAGGPPEAKETPAKFDVMNARIQDIDRPLEDRIQLSCDIFKNLIGGVLSRHGERGQDVTESLCLRIEQELESCKANLDSAPANINEYLLRVRTFIAVAANLPSKVHFDVVAEACADYASRTDSAASDGILTLSANSWYRTRVARLALHSGSMAASVMALSSCHETLTRF